MVYKDQVPPLVWVTLLGQVQNMLSQVPSKAPLSARTRHNYKRALSTILKVDLMPHQVDGIAWMNSMETSPYRGGGLADDMGLGKTLQTIMCSVMNGVNGTLIVCPNALTSGWLAEFDKLDIKITRALYHGQSRNDVNFDNYHVIVTTYGTLVAESKKPVEQSPLLARTWTRVVLDESQIMKNHTTKVATSCFALKSNYRWCLSGTPVQNKIFELYSVARFLRVPRYSDFNFFYVEVFLKGNTKMLVDAIFLRREKETTLGSTLPQKRIVDFPCPISKVEEDVYSAMQKKILKVKYIRESHRKRLEPHEQERQKQRDDNIILQLMHSLRLACDDSRLVKDKRLVLDAGPTELPADTPSSKTLAVTKLAIELVRRDKKVLIFSQYLGMISQIRKHINIKSPSTPLWSLSGSQNTPHKRDPIIAGFKQASGGAILILQTMVGSVGLNLTEASRVILVEPWWNPFVDEQAMDRVYRIGQRQEVVVYRCYIPTTIEEHILKVQSDKRDMVKKMWGKKSSGLNPVNIKLTSKEIDFLLGVK